MADYGIGMPCFTLTTPDRAAAICHQVDGEEHLMVFPSRQHALDYVRGMRVPIYNVVELATLPDLLAFVRQVATTISHPPTRIMFFAGGDARAATVATNSIPEFLAANERGAPGGRSE